MLPDVPPTCTQRRVTRPDGTTQMVWTYSGHLMDPEFDHYDPLLRSTVAWCMARRPADRPGMLQLERLIMGAAAAADRSAAEAQGRVSIAELLGVPPPATRQVPAAVQDPLAPAAPAPAGPTGPDGRGGGGFGSGRGGVWRGGGPGRGGPRGGGRSGGGDRGRGGGDRGRGGDNRGGRGRGRGRGRRGAPI